MRLRCVLFLAAQLAVGPALGAPAEAPPPRFTPLVEAPPPLDFAPLAGLGRAEGATALALDGARGRLAVGDARGVYLREPDGRVRRALGSGPVHDLAFEGDGTLLAATERGLYAIGADARVARRPLGPGEAGRALRVLPTPVGVFVATGDGVQAAAPGQPFRALDGALPGGEASALAWTPAAAGPGRLHAIVAGELYAAELSLTSGGLATARAARVPLVSRGGAPLELATAGDGAELIVLRSQGMSRETSSGFEALDPAWPPGISARRIAFGAGGVWLASDGGLLEAPALAGPWRRVAGAAGGAAASAVAVAGERVYVATARGVFASEPARSAPAAGGASHPDAAAAAEPSVGDVQRAALRYLALGSERLRRLERNVARRGFLPELTLRGDYGGFRGSDEDHDDTVFSSGGRYLLYDRLDERGRDFIVGAALRWELGNAAFDPEEIDVSKEVRELIELRDEVLDEINQLYFERRRVLLDRSQLADAASAEAERLALRAAELGAGLDAWTGGWWSRQLEPLSPRLDPEDRP